MRPRAGEICPMAFENSNITFGATGLQGENVNNPTGIAVSQTGNAVLFVTQQNGEIWRLEVERQPDGADGDTLPEFVVTSSLKISDIKNETQNYDDDGSINATQQRQMTGIVTTTDENGNDVLYVNSSDWRIAVGDDSGLDTNSGQIHKLVLDPVTGAPRELGPLIDPNVHSCGTVPPHGEEELRHPEPDFYLVGMKAYGRAPTFLLPTGYEQVRSVVAALAGDREAAQRVELELPDTGVCSADAALAADGETGPVGATADGGEVCCG